MSGYVSLPASFTSTKARPWIAKSLDYIGALPPKKPKPSKKKRSAAHQTRG
jgi:hypothetical protein